MTKLSLVMKNAINKWSKKDIVKGVWNTTTFPDIDGVDEDYVYTRYDDNRITKGRLVKEGNMIKSYCITISGKWVLRNDWTIDEFREIFGEVS